MASELENLRAEARKRQRAAGQKISRLRAKGIEVGGTEYDVRRDAKKIRSYSRPQLAAYINQLNGFTGRQTRFVPGANSKPIPLKDWNRYKQAEAVYNAKAVSHEAKFAGQKLPGSDMTIGDFSKQMRPSRVTADLPARRPLDPISRMSTMITSAEAARVLARDLKKKSRPSDYKRRINNAREGFNKMLDRIGNTDLKGLADKLTDAQFDIVWNYTQVPYDISRSYGIAVLAATNSESRPDQHVMETNAAELATMLNWATAIPIQKPAQNRANGRKKNPRKSGS